MSHNKERVEKVCLNCGAHVNGRYCHVCGQENTEPKETVWGLVSHFFNDITHFDGKFFSTGKYLLTKPGFLSAEYLKGRRASYLHPIRLYVFTSAFFFIIFFSLFNVSEILKGKQNKEEKLKELKEASTGLKEELPKTRDSVLKMAIVGAITGIDKHVFLLEKEIEDKKHKDSISLIKTKQQLNSAGIKIPGLPDSLLKTNIKTGSADDDDSLENSSKAKINVQKISYGSRLAYDSVQERLPESKRDGWFTRLMIHKTAKLNSKWKDDKKETMSLFAEKFMHTLPQALFVSLPIFALVLLMLYARRSFYYVDHGIFAIHLYCASFIILLLYFAVDKIEASVHGSVFTYIKLAIMLGMLFYLYKAMRRFYRQGRAKTITKFLILLLVSLFGFAFLAGAFVFLSLLQFS